MKKLIALFIVITFAFYPTGSYASKLKEIGYTASYGVLAGTIVGVASLAFSSSPGSHLRNIAVGASLGLYAGILLGAYLAYGVKLEPEIEKIDEDEDEDIESDDEEDSFNLYNNFNNQVYSEIDLSVNGQRNQLLQDKLLIKVPIFTYSF